MEPAAPTATKELALRAVLEGPEGHAARASLLERLMPMWLALARRLLSGRREDAEDVAQQVGLIVLKGLFRLVQLDSIRAWTFRVVRNLCVNVLRGKQASPDEAAFDVADPAPGGRTRFWTREGEERLRGTIRALPEDLRALAELASTGEMTIEQMATELGEIRSTVHYRLKKVRARLRDELGADVLPPEEVAP